MEFLAQLWLPILVAAVAVFIVSSILHMVIPVHAGDYKKLPDEGKVLEAMRSAGVGQGAYMFPCPGSMKEMSSPEMMEKYKAGPVGHMTLMPVGPPAIGKSLIQWFLYSVLMGVFVAYLSFIALHDRSPDYLAVFRVAGTVGVLGYATAYFHDSIWKGLSWKISIKFMIDGVIYGLVTAGVFAWLWPSTGA